jgi:hypothetical protein
MRSPTDDPDKRPLLERIKDPVQLAEDVREWVVPVFDLVEDEDLRKRCLLLVASACTRIYELSERLAEIEKR